MGSGQAPIFDDEAPNEDKVKKKNYLFLYLGTCDISIKFLYRVEAIIFR